MSTTSRVPRGSRGRAAPPPPEPPRPAAAIVAVQKLFSAEAPEYFLLLGTTLFLVIFGLVMVLSSSSIESYVNNDKDFFATATRQGLYALIGVPVMLLAARTPVSFWKRWAGVAVVAGIALQLLVFTGLGYGYGGNQNWIRIGSFTAQPSELIKLALVVWLAWILSKRGAELDDWRRIALPIGPVVLVSVGLVLVGRDLGTALIIVAIVLGALFYAGVRLRVIVVTIAAAAVLGAITLSLSSSRQDRIQAWLGGCKDPSLALTDCYQTVGGWQAMAHGGLFGV
ncbi:MAG TPA: FtsW/RodA/SpoVE family cell cycle protein, partial [Pseudolysinimonas sp.]|nr:FtsW/RodA/SpoVE family cell cycle protein [Pseudolysinimonas sp.]